MIARRRPGFPGDTKPEGFWPLVLVSGILHFAAFWSLARLDLHTSQKLFPPSLTMVELGRTGWGTGTEKTAVAPARAPAVEPSAPRGRAEKPVKAQSVRPRAQARAVGPRETPKAEPRAKPVPPKPRREPVPTAPPEKPAPEVKPPPRAAPPVPERPLPSSQKPRVPEPSEDPVAERIARIREKRAPPSDDPIADRIARIREKRGESGAEADVADRIAKLRTKQIQGSEAQVSRRIEALREKYGTREPSKEGPGRAGPDPKDGPLAVQGSGAQGAAGLAEEQYLRNVKAHLDLHWSVPEALKGKGYRAAATVIVDRRGVITEWALQRSGNRLFDERVERAIAEANPLPAVPNALPGQRFEYELRFSAP